MDFKFEDIPPPKPPEWERIDLIKNESYVVYIQEMGWVIAIYIGLAPEASQNPVVPIHVLWNENGIYHVPENWIKSMPE